MQHGSGFYIYNKKRRDFSNEKDNLILEIILESKEEGLELNQILKILENKLNQKIENYVIEIAKDYQDYNE